MSSTKAKCKDAQPNVVDAQPSVVEPNRIYAEQMTIDSDLFKLEIENLLKNNGFDDKDPVLGNVEHCHFYRTFDSDGRKQTKCSSVGGHYHNVTAKILPDGSLQAIAGPAIGAKFGDKHEHKTTYLRSDKVERRIRTKEAQEYIAQMQAPI